MTHLFLLHYDRPIGSIVNISHIKIILFINGYIIFYLLLRSNRISYFLILNSIIFSGLAFSIILITKILLLGSEYNFLVERLGIPSEVNPNTVAMFLDFIFPLTLFLSFCQERKNFKILYIALAIFFLLIILLTSSRGSLLGILVIGMYFVLKNFTIKKFVYIICPICILLVAVSPIVFSRIVSQDAGTAMSNIYRLEHWQTAWKIIESNNFLFGAGMYAYSYLKYSFGFPLVLDPNRTMSTHNLFIEYAVGIGFIGLLGMLILMINPLLKLFKTHIDDKNNYIRLGIMFSLLSYYLHSLVDCGFLVYPLLMFNYILLAAASTLSQEYKTSYAPK